MERNAESFLLLIEQHKRIIYRISRMYVDNSEDREDLSQEILLQLWRSYKSFREESRFSTWMYRVALNTAITFLKKEKKAVQRNAIDSWTENIAVQHEEADPRLEQLYIAVRSLNNIEKAVIFLYLENQSHKEIADKLGITVVNARIKLMRAKEKIQLLFK